MKKIKNINYILDGIKRNIKISHSFKKIEIDETINLSNALTLDEFIRIEKSKLKK